MSNLTDESARGKKSGKTIEELESLCEQMSLRIAIMKGKLRQVSKMLNLAINEKEVTEI